MFNGFAVSRVCLLLFFSFSLSFSLSYPQPHHVIDLVCHLPYNSKSSRFSCFLHNVYFCMLIPSHAALQILLSFVTVPNQSCLFWPELIVPFRIVNAAVFTTPTFISIPFICHFLFPLLTHLDRSATQVQKQRVLNSLNSFAVLVCSISAQISSHCYSFWCKHTPFLCNYYIIL